MPRTGRPTHESSRPGPGEEQRSRSPRGPAAALPTDHVERDQPVVRRGHLSSRIAELRRSTASAISGSTGTGHGLAVRFEDAAVAIRRGPARTGAAGTGRRQLVRVRVRRRAGESAGRTTVRPAAVLAASMTRVCSRRAFVAQTDDSGHGHTVSQPESGSKPTMTTCPASSGAMASHCSRSVAPAVGSSTAAFADGPVRKRVGKSVRMA